MHFRYRRDYYINDSKIASGSRELKAASDVESHYDIDDNDYEHLDNADGNNVSDSDSFYNRRQKRSRYCYTHLFKPSILRMMTPKIFQETSFDLKRSQSVCSAKTFDSRKRFNVYNNDEDFIPNQMCRRTPHEDQSQEDCQVITQLERDTLYSDIRRYSFSSRRGTKNFVINPLYNDY